MTNPDRIYIPPCCIVNPVMYCEECGNPVCTRHEHKAYGQYLCPRCCQKRTDYENGVN